MPEDIIFEIHKWLNCGNASNITNSLGRQARDIIDETKKEIAKFLNIKNDDFEIIFTSSGSESNALFIYGIAHGIYQKEKSYQKTKKNLVLLHQPSNTIQF